MRFRQLAGVVLAGIVASCGGSRAPETNLSTTSTVATWTSESVAAVIARHRPDIYAAIDMDEKCPATIECLAAAARISRLRAILAAAQPLGNELRAVIPPPAMNHMVVDTLTKIENLSGYDSSVTNCLRREEGAIAPCEKAMLIFTNGTQALRASLRAWDAYL